MYPKQRTLMGNPYIRPISCGYSWVFCSSQKNSLQKKTPALFPLGYTSPTVKGLRTCTSWAPKPKALPVKSILEAKTSQGDDWDDWEPRMKPYLSEKKTLKITVSWFQLGSSLVWVEIMTISIQGCWWFLTFLHLTSTCELFFKLLAGRM